MKYPDGTVKGKSFIEKTRVLKTPAKEMKMAPKAKLKATPKKRKIPSEGGTYYV